MTMKLLTNTFDTPNMKLVDRTPKNPSLLSTDIKVNKGPEKRFIIFRMPFIYRMLYGLRILQKVTEDERT